MSSVRGDNSTAMGAAVSQGGAQNALIGGLTAVALYGIFFVLFCMTIHILCFRRKRASTSPILLLASLAIFIFTTIDVVIECHRLLVGLLYTPASEMDQYFNSGGDWLFVLQDAIRIVNMLIGDSVLLYRAWIVWEKRWVVVIFNILVWLGTLVASIRIVQIQGVWSQDISDYLLTLDMVTWSLVTQSLTLAQTITATGLIGFRLWQIDSAASQFKDTSLLPVVRILIESGTLYTSLQLANVVVTALISPGLYVILQLTSPIIAITFSLIIVRVGLGISSETRSTAGAMSHRSRPSQGISVDIRRQIDSDGLVGNDGRSSFDGGKESVKMMPLRGRSAEDV